MTTLIRRTTSFILLLSVLISFTACRGQTDKSKLPLVRYSSFRVPDPAYIALKKGFFEKRGINVEFIETPGGTTSLQAVAAGRAEVGGAPVASLISAVANGMPVIGVSDYQSAVPGFPMEEFFVRSDSTIQSLSDLKGHKIAVNSVGGSFQYTIFLALEKAGMKQEDIEFVILPFENQVQALIAGEVDMIGLLPPHSTKASAMFSKQVRILFSALDVFGNKQFTVHAVNTDWAKKNPELVRAWVGGIADAVEWIHSHPEETKQLMAEYTTIEIEYIPVYRFQEKGQIITKDIQFWIDFIQRYNNDVNTTNISPEQVATNKFNPYLNP
jgi:NitT/TauT family transport system substrate-binding protein